MSSLALSVQVVSSPHSVTFLQLRQLTVVREYKGKAVHAGEEKVKVVAAFRRPGGV